MTRDDDATLCAYQVSQRRYNRSTHTALKINEKKTHISMINNTQAPLGDQKTKSQWSTLLHNSGTSCIIDGRKFYVGTPGSS